MKPKVYIETTIPSYLTAWLSRDLVTAAHQQITREWWQTRRQDFDLFTAQIVIDEASEGDSEAATRRLEVLEDIPLLEPSQEVAELAQTLIEQIPFPERATDDAIHIAMAVVGGMDLPFNLELYSYCECSSTKCYRICLPKSRLRSTNHLYT